MNTNDVRGKAPVLLNGNIVEATQAAIPIDDLGFSMGVALVERLRTYAHQPCLLPAHLDRLEKGLALLRLDEQIQRTDLERQVATLVQHNLKLASRDSDLSIGIIVTPGSRSKREPTLLITAEPIDFSYWKPAVESGIRLQTVSTREIPQSVIAKSIKHRSRLHYHVANMEADAERPGSHPLLLDTHGFVAESSTGTVVAREQQTLLAPPQDSVLASITLSKLEQHLKQTNAELSVSRVPLTIERLQSADALYWLNATVGIAPIASLDETSYPIERDPFFAKLIKFWQAITGIDVRQQMIDCG